MKDLFEPPAIVRSEAAELTALATAINQAHEEGERSTRAGLERFRAAGQRLIEAKARCGHGKWLAWLKSNVRFSERTARDYMRLASNWEKTAVAADLRSALRLLTDEPESEKPPAVLPSSPATRGDIRAGSRSVSRRNTVVSPEGTESGDGEENEATAALVAEARSLLERSNADYWIVSDSCQGLIDLGWSVDRIAAECEMPPREVREHLAVLKKFPNDRPFWFDAVESLTDDEQHGHVLIAEDGPYLEGR